MSRVLLTDNIADAALAVFEDYPDIEAVRTGTLPPEQLKQTIGDFDAIIVRSPTKVTADVIASGQRGTKFASDVAYRRRSATADSLSPIRSRA